MEQHSSSLTTVARLGLIAKGIVYILVGALAFMAAFEVGGQSSKTASKEGAFQTVLDLPAGNIILGTIAIGLLCYSIWRFVQVGRKQSSSASEGASKKVRYALSGLIYLSLAFLAAKMALQQPSGSGASDQERVSQVMEQSYGHILLIIAALIIAGVGIYQLWYAFSEKYKKHINNSSVHDRGARVLMPAGKLGYAARGFVWLIIAWMLGNAAMHYNASEAGGTTKAFEFVESSTYGSYLLGALALGLICYGIFNFMRARYERFD
jgi:uncharacterized membrane protein YidH (DUF202 family)